LKVIETYDELMYEIKCHFVLVQSRGHTYYASEALRYTNFVSHQLFKIVI